NKREKSKEEGTINWSRLRSWSFAVAAWGPLYFQILQISQFSLSNFLRVPPLAPVAPFAAFSSVAYARG
ncbi:hypothetical protein SDJN02_03033, partial [Cucurbita argyrosperma subsp. argyrosperma]